MNERPSSRACSYLCARTTGLSLKRALWPIREGAVVILFSQRSSRGSHSSALPVTDEHTIDDVQDLKDAIEGLAPRPTTRQSSTHDLRFNFGS